ncbi:hypothetical protein AAZX31_15G091900 [Glycine max]
MGFGSVEISEMGYFPNDYIALLIKKIILFIHSPLGLVVYRLLPFLLLCSYFLVSVERLSLSPFCVRLGFLKFTNFRHPLCDLRSVSLFICSDVVGRLFFHFHCAICGRKRSWSAIALCE